MRAPRQTAWLDRFLTVRLAGAGAAARRELDAACRRSAESLRDVMILAVVSDSPGVCSSEVARLLGLQSSEVYRAVGELEYDGLVEVRRNKGARVNPLRPTAAGAEALRRGEAAIQLVELQLLKHLTPLRQRQLSACLDIIRGPKSAIGEAMFGLDFG